MKLKSLIICLSLVVSAISFAASPMKGNKGNKKKVNFSLMSYNLENMFDITHDVGKSDWTWLPLKFKRSSKEAQAYCQTMTNEYYRRDCLELDWSEKVMTQKIKNVSKVILSYNKGRGADVVVFEEIENITALNYLVNKGLSKNGYRYKVLIEGPDSRGIDVAIISKYPVISSQYHQIDLAPYSTRSTRGILEAKINVRGKLVTVFANHWPSQGNVSETRELASIVLKNAAMNVKSGLVVAAGDFNTTHNDHPHGINNNILPYFEDVEVMARKVKDIPVGGTHWYRGEWESLDKIFVLKSSLSKTAQIDHKSFEIIYEKFMLQDLEWTDRDTGETHLSKNIPIRFDATTGQGFSDHLPVAVSFSL